MIKIQIAKAKPADQQIGLIYAGIGLLGLVLAQFGEVVLAVMPPCLFHKWTGLPCPTCGATRAGIALGHFNMLEAARLNPLFFCLYIALFFWGMNTIFGAVLGKKLAITMAANRKKMVQILLVSAIILNWLYLVWATKF